MTVNKAHYHPGIVVWAKALQAWKANLRLEYISVPCGHISAFSKWSAIFPRNHIVSGLIVGLCATAMVIARSALLM